MESGHRLWMTAELRYLAHLSFRVSCGVIEAWKGASKPGGAQGTHGSVGTLRREIRCQSLYSDTGTARIVAGMINREMMVRNCIFVRRFGMGVWWRL
jgi:hypothetical protein